MAIKLVYRSKYLGFSKSGAKTWGAPDVILWRLTPALRAPARTAYPTNPLAPVIKTRDGEDIVNVTATPYQLG